MRVRKLFLCEFTAIISLACLFILCAPQAYAQSSFTYPLFPTTAPAGLQTNSYAENAAVITSGNTNYLQLTTSAGDEVGSAWYTNPAGQVEGAPAPLSLALAPFLEGFTTTFTLQFTNQGGVTGGPEYPCNPNVLSSSINCAYVTGADGIAFVVQNGSFNDYQGDNTSGASAVGPNDTFGGEIGFTGLTNSVAVQFDTFCNSGYSDTCATNDPYSSADQITVESCGPNPNTVNHTGGCQFGTVDLSALGTPIYLADGNPHPVQITYTPPPSTGSCPIGSTPNSGGCGSLTVMIGTAGSIPLTTVLTVPFNLNYLDLDENYDAYVGFTGATGGSWETQNILAWAFGPPSVQTVTTNVNLSTTPVVVSDFSVPMITKQLILDYTSGSNYTNPTTILLVTSSPLTDDNAAAPLTIGTPFATAIPFPDSVDTQANNGVATGNRFDIACYNGTTVSDANCPSTGEGSITVSDVYNQQTPKVSPPLGTTIGLLHCHGANCWEPALPGVLVNPACSNPYATVPPEQTYPANCSLQNIFGIIFGDQTTTQSKGKPPNPSSISTMYNVYYPETIVYGEGTTNSTYVPLNSQPGNVPSSPMPWFSELQQGELTPLNLQFYVTPACPVPNSEGVLSPSTDSTCLGIGVAATNYFMPAPICCETYSVIAVPSGNVVVTPTMLTTTVATVSPAPPVTFPAATLPILSDGYYSVPFFSQDSVGTLEQNPVLVTIPPAPGGTTCPNPTGGSSFNPPCYETLQFSAPFGVDSTPPVITSTERGLTYPANSAVAAAYTCTDYVAPAVGSGVQYCTSTVPGTSTCTGQGTGVETCKGGNINTTPNGIKTTQSFTVNSSDIAGNQSTQTITYYVSCHYITPPTVSPLTITPPGIVIVTTGVSNKCTSVSETISVQVIISGPASCSTFKPLQFTTPSFTLKPGVSVPIPPIPFVIPKNACPGTFSATVNTLQNGNVIDTSTLSLTIL